MTRLLKVLLKTCTLFGGLFVILSGAQLLRVCGSELLTLSGLSLFNTGILLVICCIGASFLFAGGYILSLTCMSSSFRFLEGGVIKRRSPAAKTIDTQSGEWINPSAAPEI
jgi:hypothetical protein